MAQRNTRGKPWLTVFFVGVLILAALSLTTSRVNPNYVEVNVKAAVTIHPQTGDLVVDEIIKQMPGLRGLTLIHGTVTGQARNLHFFRVGEEVYVVPSKPISLSHGSRVRFSAAALGKIGGRYLYKEYTIAGRKALVLEGEVYKPWN